VRILIFKFAKLRGGASKEMHSFYSLKLVVGSFFFFLFLLFGHPYKNILLKLLRDDRFKERK
jgi:hypothetical protein